MERDINCLELYFAGFEMELVTRRVKGTIFLRAYIEEDSCWTIVSIVEGQCKTMHSARRTVGLFL